MRLTTRTCQVATVASLTCVILLNIRLLQDPKENSAERQRNGVAQSYETLQFKSPLPSITCYPNLRNATSQVISMNITESLTKRWVDIRAHQVQVLGHARSKPVFLTIGIPSIKRVNGLEYLLMTLQSLVDQTKDEQKKQVVIVVFLADFDTTYKAGAMKTIYAKFKDYVDSGFIQVVQVSKDFYPPLDNLKRNFGDKADRVHWRSKQVVDFSFMFLYCRNLSTFYLQIEDDVITAKDYLLSIQEYISLQTKHWASLEFSELGFIGKLFKSADLNKLAQYMMLFYDEQPVDWLIRYFRLSMAQVEVKLRKPTLFQHMGKKSSFDIRKSNNLKDRYFDDGSKPVKVTNPQAELFTSIKKHEDYKIDLAYSPGSSYFWGKNIKKGDTVYVLFDKPVYIQRIFIKTGSQKHPSDTLLSGRVDISSRVLSADPAKGVICTDYKPVGTLTNGGLDVDKLNDTYPMMATRCVRILVTEDQRNWLIIHQIAVFTVPNSTSTI